VGLHSLLTSGKGALDNEPWFNRIIARH